MKVLVIGSGGREHALVWKIKQSPLLSEIYCVPGNGGIKELAECVYISMDDISGLLEYVQNKQIDFTVVGPEQPLALGIVDAFEKNNLKIFGPNREAAQLESSKGFAKQFMQKYNIPTAQFKLFDNYHEAHAYVQTQGCPIVIKTDGLAAGKGAVVCHEEDHAFNTLKDMMLNETFGAAGKKVVIEEFLTGEELSVIAITDSKIIQPFVPAQDHKPVYDGDQGPNTGGMGSFAPVPFADQDFMNRVQEEILDPVLDGLARQDIAYKGILYAGLMATQSGPKVIEFNARFGDPETQAILPLLNIDLLELLMLSSEGKLPNKSITIRDGYCTCVVLASEGYPGNYEKDKMITGLEPDPNKDTIIFHAGTKLQDGKVFTNGGRVLGVSAYGKTLKSSIQKAYDGVEKIQFDGMFFRKDIGQKGLESLEY